MATVSVAMQVQTAKINARPVRTPWVLWVGPRDRAELRLAHDSIRPLAEIRDADSPSAAVSSRPPGPADRTPAVILLAVDSPVRWSLDDVIPLAIRWPLAPIISVAGTLVDGRRRSGPPLAGIEEVPWHDLPGRLACWLADLAAGRPGTLGIPATARREERLLEASAPRRFGLPVPAVAAAAATTLDLDGLVDLLAAAGLAVVRRHRGRPPLDEPAAAVVWDVGRLDGEHVAWLRMLSANRPGTKIVVLDSFPRPETSQAARAAGAAAVLGRPASAEALAGVLARRR